MLDEFPDDVSAANDLGYLWADENKHLERALRMIQQAVAAEPDNCAYRDSLGWVLFSLGTIPAGRRRAAEGGAPTKSPTRRCLEHLGDVLRQGSQAATTPATPSRRAAAAFRKEKEGSERRSRWKKS